MEKEKINLRNMPCGQLFEYADGKYVWKIMRAHGTRNGNYLSATPDLSKYTEVFRQGNNGLEPVWSGRLITNPGVYNEECLDQEGCFSIFSYDQDTSSSFHQDFDLKTAPIELQLEALKSEISVLEYTSSLLEEQKGRGF